MVSADIFLDSVDKILAYGQKINVMTFTGSVGPNDYDDVISYTKQSGPTWNDGVILPLKNKYGSEDAVLIEQGKLLFTDKKLYLKGDVTVSGNILVGIGSPSSTYYNVISPGRRTVPVLGSDIFHKMYIRYHHAGSNL